MIAYYGSKISEHMTKTPEGFLICHDVPIARTGMQEYLAGELGLDGEPDRPVAVERRAEDVFDPAAIASFEGKDVTFNHPPEMLAPVNQNAYSKGHAENVHRAGDTRAVTGRVKPSDFYPRPPRGGRRGILRSFAARQPISIHALREEGDRAAAVWR